MLFLCRLFQAGEYDVRQEGLETAFLRRDGNYTFTRSGKVSPNVREILSVTGNFSIHVFRRYRPLVRFLRIYSL